MCHAKHLVNSQSQEMVKLVLVEEPLNPHDKAGVQFPTRRVGRGRNPNHRMNPDAPNTESDQRETLLLRLFPLGGTVHQPKNVASRGQGPGKHSHSSSHGYLWIKTQQDLLASRHLLHTAKATLSIIANQPALLLHHHVHRLLAVPSLV